MGASAAGHLDPSRRYVDGEYKFFHGVPFVTRGVEMRPKTNSKDKDDATEAFSAPISRGVHQLQYAHVPRLSEILAILGGVRERELAGFEEGHIDISSLVLVTTAELWTFRTDVDLEGIQKAKSLEEIAERAGAVEYATAASRELRGHQELWIDRTDRTRFTSRDEEQVLKHRAVWEAVRAAVKNASPSVFIVNNGELETTLKAQEAALVYTIREFVEDVAVPRGFGLGSQ